MQGVDPRAVNAEHPLDLVVDPLFEQHPYRQAVGRQGLHLGGGKRCAVRQGDTRRKARFHFSSQRRVQRDGVGLGDMALRGQDVVGKAAVIRQQHEAGAGLVQPPGREQFPPGVGIAQQVHDGGVPLVGGGADHTFGLVQHDVDELLVRQRSPFHGHHIRLPELGVPFFAERAVHGHFPLLQQRLRLAPGALGRLGQIFIQSHGFSL